MAVEHGLDRGRVFQNDPVDLAVMGVAAQGVACGGLSDLFGQRPQFQQADDQMQRIAVRVARTIRIADRYIGIERLGFEEKGQLLCGRHLVDRVVDGLNRQRRRGGLERCGRHRGHDHRKHGSLPYSRRE